MTQKAKREAARSKLLRLLKGLEFYRAWRIAAIKKVRGEVRQEDLNEIVEPSIAFLEYFDNAGGQYIQILQDVGEWYSHTFSDLCLMMNTGSDAELSEIHQFLADFQSEVGFDFKSEAGLVAKTIQKALKAGKITKKSDYFILKEIENDVNQTLLKGSDLDAVSNMLRHFEDH